ncbi:MAG: YjbF family lipoprotein [Rhodobacteraceae bacterium]|nr:YjbF family lipoprotein [Paracoccaceae bacterium]
MTTTQRSIWTGLSRRIALVAGLAALAGCTTGNQGSSYWTEVGQILARGVDEIQRGRPDRVIPTRAQLNQFFGNVETIEVVIPSRDLYDFVRLIDRRTDRSPGELKTYQSFDLATVTFRNGVLVNTRSIGGDVLSHSVAVTGAVPGPIDVGERRLEIFALDNKSVGVFLDCQIRSEGTKQIVVYEITHTAEHLIEDCSWGSNTLDRNGTIQNEYWVSPSQNVVWKSRQWAGPLIGYIETQQITR